MSFCGEGIKSISPTQFEMRRSDFVPENDLYVLILRPLPKDEEPASSGAPKAVPPNRR